MSLYLGSEVVVQQDVGRLDVAVDLQEHFRSVPFR